MDLVAACEQILQAHGPRALARRTGRSASWWSRLQSGKHARFPTWHELTGLFPADLSPEARAELQERYREALRLYLDPEQLSEAGAGKLVVPVETLREQWRIANEVGFINGDDRAGLTLLAVVDQVLSAVPPEQLSPEGRKLLVDCLEKQAGFEMNLGNAEAAVPLARRAAAVYRLDGDPAQELIGAHLVGLAYQFVKDWPRAQQEFLRLVSPYRRVNDQGGVVRALRDAGIAETSMGKHSEAEAHLLASLEAAASSTADYRYPTLFWLADLNVRRGKLEEAREWLARIQRIEERSAAELEDWPRFAHIRHHRRGIERQLAEKDQHRKDRR